MKGEGPLGNLLEMGKERVCAEGLLRREIKVVLRLCIPCSERASLPASKNTVFQEGRYLLDWEMEKCPFVISCTSAL